MLYKNTQELLELLKKNNLWAQKKLGQNFLVNPEVLKKIVETAEIKSTDFILEIGPGLGILTEELAKNAGKVKSLELDSALIPFLENQFRNSKNVEILLQDALKFAPPYEPYKLVANIPYYITSPILNHFLRETHERSEAETATRESSKRALQPNVLLIDKTTRSEAEATTTYPLRPSLIVLLVQKEVAEKICARAGDHSVLSLQVQIFGEPQIICKVPRNSFYPAPKVDSAVIKIKTYTQPLIQDTKTFFKLIHGCFAQKRKTLSNSLKSALPISKEEIHALLTKAQIDPMRRPQELTIEEWQRLCEFTP